MARRAGNAAEKIWKDTTEMALSVSLKSITGRSFAEKGVRVTCNNLEYFVPSLKTRREARRELEREGFKVIAESRAGLSLVGEKKLVESVFGAEVGIRTHTVTHAKKKIKMHAPEGRFTVPPAWAGTIDRVKFEPYPIPLESATPPTVDYYHLDVPDDVADLLGASQLHPCGYDGSGIKLCMIDDGFFNHAYYTAQGYSITLVPVNTTTMPPELGHGTAIASNAFAVAPGVDFVFVNHSIFITYILGIPISLKFPLAAFRAAKEENPDIITCSWGMEEYDADLAWEIADAVSNGTVVVFACGNGGTVYFPGCMNEVISVGGVFPEEGGGFHASTYASSGDSPLNPGRQCPDLCGLVGDDPHGVLIMMPTTPDDYYDGLFAGDDDTAADDGWICASGTSSAAPQVAGVAALLLQCDPSLTPAAVKAILQNTALDVTAGSSASGEPAGPGVDLATGHGLVDAVAAMDDAGCTCPPCEGFCEGACMLSCEYSCMPAFEPFCHYQCEMGCMTLCQAAAVACVPITMTGCRVSAMMGPGGCGPVSLIAHEFPWEIYERYERPERLTAIARERIARMGGGRYERGVHTRRLTRPPRLR